jgi:hypothetical protein
MKAYPIMYKHPTTGLIVEEQGMELRDYIAVQALIGYLTTREYADEDLPGMSYQMADWMLKQREEKADE